MRGWRLLISDEVCAQLRPILVVELHTQSGAGALLRDEWLALADI